MAAPLQKQSNDNFNPKETDKKSLEYFEIEKDDDLLIGDQLVQGIKEDKINEDKETKLNSIKGLLLMVVAQIINTMSLVLLKVMYR